MNSKLFIKICAMVLVAVSLLAFASCSNDGDEGNVVSQDNVDHSENNNAPGTSNNKGNPTTSLEAKFVTSYSNWLLNDIIGGFEKGMKTAIAQDKDYGKLAVKTVSGFFTSEIKDVMSAVKEFEENKKYTNAKIREVKKNKAGIYLIKMADGSDNKKDADYELVLSTNKKEISLVKYSENAEELLTTEIVLTDDGYIAIQRSQRPSVSEKWENVQIMYKGDEGYFVRKEGLSEAANTIYGTQLPEGFAGKK